VLFGLGMSGASHYSTSMLLTTLDSALELQLESACVAKAQPNCGSPRLGSRWNWFPEFELMPDGAAWRLEHQRDRVPVVRILPNRDLCKLHLLDIRQFEIQPLTIENSGTTQWKYRFVLLSS